MGKKFGEPCNGVAADTGKDVFEPRERIHADALAGSDETSQHGGGPAAFIAAKEHPVVASNGHPADGALAALCRLPDYAA